MRQADIVFALCLLVLAGLVAWESLALSIGWNNGPAGGFFLLVGSWVGLSTRPRHPWAGPLACRADAAQTTRSAGVVGTAVDGRHPSHRHGRSLCMH